MVDLQNCLRSTAVIDCDSQSIKEKAQSVIQGLQNDREKAIALFYYVRDEIKHNPYASHEVLEDYRASYTLERGHGLCQHKSVLLVALARAVGIPARLGFVDIRDHQMSEKFRTMIGGDNVIITHGYAELYVGGKWVHASPVYDLESCQKAGFVPVEFDGVNDAKDSAYNREGERHIEHIKDHGHFDDLPFEYMRKYAQEWVTQIGREWEEFWDNVKKHEIT